MTIKTKFNVKQEVFYIEGAKIARGWVKKIEVEVWWTNGDNPIESYRVASDMNCTNEVGKMGVELLFNSPTSLAKHLLEGLETN